MRMYLPSLSDEEFLRYADHISDPLVTSELEREFAKRLRAAVDEKSSDIKDLEEMVSELEKQNEELQEQIDALDKENYKLTEEITRLEEAAGVA